MNSLRTNTDSRSSPPPPTINPDTHKAARRINETIGNSKDILATATTVFPITLFPSVATVDREKITIAHRFFFRTAEVVTIRIEDILNVSADIGPWLGSLKVYSRFFHAEPYTINYLHRGDALRLKRILQGYVIAIQKSIDCSKFDAGQLTIVLDELGEGSPAKDM